MKYSPQLTKEMAEHLALGCSRTDTCEIVGISYETFTVWMQKSEFAEAIKKGEQRCKRRNIGLIQKAAQTTWQAAAWWLERKYRDEFALRTEFTGADGRPIQVQIVNYANQATVNGKNGNGKHAHSAH